MACLSARLSIATCLELHRWGEYLENVMHYSCRINPWGNE
jgi:hypothetical protein